MPNSPHGGLDRHQIWVLGKVRCLTPLYVAKFVTKKTTEIESDALPCGDLRCSFEVTMDRVYMDKRTSGKSIASSLQKLDFKKLVSEITDLHSKNKSIPRKVALPCPCPFRTGEPKYTHVNMLAKNIYICNKYTYCISLHIHI